jgi:NAD(P)-dependent dehydrogenase (short-subunit alcohol dehydrogenase family)
MQRGFGIMSTTNQSKIVPRKVLVTGASGLLGVAAIEKFLAAGWEVIGVSRRKPELPSGRKIDFLSVDLRDEEKTRAVFEPSRFRDWGLPWSHLHAVRPERPGFDLLR